MHGLAEARADLAIVEDDSANEPLARGVLEFSQAAKITVCDRRGSLDFDSGKVTRSLLEHDIDLEPVTITEMEK